MTQDGLTERRFTKLYEAFAADGFAVVKRAFTESGRMGLAARHEAAFNYDTKQKKTAYYLEGTPYERGYLQGLLAEPSVADMAVNFADNIIFNYIGLDFLNHFTPLQKLIVALMRELSHAAWLSLPAHVHDEVTGLLDGCQKSNPSTKVTKDRLIVLNVGFDVLCALVYTGGMLRERVPQLKAEDLRLKMMCNAFSVLGPAAGGGHYFVRDFMFATGAVLQNNMAHIVHRPDISAGVRQYAHVNVTAPGIVGALSAMNEKGVAGGVNMSPAANCDPEQIGINSLLLLRDCLLRGGSALEAASVIRHARRGVSWNYVISDGGTDTACTVEAGASWPHTGFLDYPPVSLRPYLPDAAYFDKYMAAPVINGAVVRWCGEPLPQDYLSFNSGLWQAWNTVNQPRIVLYADAMLPGGFINRTPHEKNCPSTQYFAPQRTGPNVHITTNHALLPHMRLCAMDAWVARLAGGQANDIQWRYDALNHQIRQELKSHGQIDNKAARRLAEFLSPNGAYPHYYQKNPMSRDGKALRIEGCVSLFDLKAQTVESHYGYFSDDWVKTTLPAYL
jgi:hypothetical protein